MGSTNHSRVCIIVKILFITVEPAIFIFFIFAIQKLNRTKSTKRKHIDGSSFTTWKMQLHIQILILWNGCSCPKINSHGRHQTKSRIAIIQQV